jgi:enoyl-CoA hydratase
MSTDNLHNDRDELLVHIDNHIAHVILNRPNSRNALTFTMYENLAEICSRAGTADDSKHIKAIIISGAGDKAFAAGTDIGQFTDFTNAEDGQAYEARMEMVITEIETCKVPVIAALHGAVTGGGLVIASAAHIRVASTAAVAGMPIARTLGNCLAVSNLRRLTALFGESRVAHMILTAELIDADGLLASGFVHEILADQHALMARATEIADRMKTMAPLTIQASLEGLRRLRNAVPLPNDKDLIKRSYVSADFDEGVRAFLEKRKPEWQGK